MDGQHPRSIEQTFALAQVARRYPQAGSLRTLVVVPRPPVSDREADAVMLAADLRPRRRHVWASRISPARWRPETWRGCVTCGEMRRHGGARTRRCWLSVSSAPRGSCPCPISASSGTTTGRHRLYRGGHRQANATPYRSAIVRMRFHRPTIDFVAPRRRRRHARTRDHPLRRALAPARDPPTRDGPPPRPPIRQGGPADLAS
jgi:hypothetical protein